MGTSFARVPPLERRFRMLLATDARPRLASAFSFSFSSSSPAASTSASIPRFSPPPPPPSSSAARTSPRRSSRALPFASTLPAAASTAAAAAAAAPSLRRAPSRARPRVPLSRRPSSFRPRLAQRARPQRRRDPPHRLRHPRVERRDVLGRLARELARDLRARSDARSARRELPSGIAPRARRAACSRTASRGSAPWRCPTR